METQTLDASPTKEFFMSILTRDITLNDAILDLLDNCIDGAYRILKSRANTHLDNFGADITISSEKFVIQDNCGGIPLEVATQYAFRMGKPQGTPNDQIATVGVYGIGMKRAIFKMGHTALIQTNNMKDGAYNVLIPSDWETKKEWDLDYQTHPEDPLTTTGTRITVENLHSNISRIWNNSDGSLESAVDKLSSDVSMIFSLIIDKGFTITINGKKISSRKIKLIAANDFSDNKITPYISYGERNDVQWSVMVGLNSPLKEDDMTAKHSSDDAGITIICNDRVIILNDKTFQTGWGDDPVPRYHTQFISISGVAIFTSNYPARLPMTTTKRAIDPSSDLYSDVKQSIKEGLKTFTDYTNNWKRDLNDENEVSRSTETRTVTDLLQYIPSTDDTVKPSNDVEPNHLAPKFIKKRHKDYSSYKPVLPTVQTPSTDSVIHFRRENQEIQFVREYLTPNNSSTSPSDLGKMCFDRTLQEAKLDRNEDD